MTSMIRLSDDNAAQVIYDWLGGDDSIEDMIETCRLQDATVYPGWWSKTEISSRDLARLGDCITPGKNKFLSPSVGAPLLALMRSVDPTNAFGIEQVHPAGPGREERLDRARQRRRHGLERQLSRHLGRRQPLGARGDDPLSGHERAGLRRRALPPGHQRGPAADPPGRTVQLGESSTG
jgi:hypothetical protein